MNGPYRTCALLGFTVALVSAGYFFAPAPAATSPLHTLVTPKVSPVPSAQVAQVEARPTAQPVAKPAGVETKRAPVPLVTQRHTKFYPVPSADPKQASELMDGQVQALAMPVAEDDSQARRAIEFDGYRRVRDLTKAPDGSWRARAMRGSVEIVVRVSADGSVSVD